MEERTNTTTTTVATHAHAAAGATRALSYPAPAPHPSSSAALLLGLRRLMRLLLLLLITVVRQRHHGTVARVIRKETTTQHTLPARMGVRYRDPTRITGPPRSFTRVGPLRKLAVPPPSLAFRMRASIAVDRRRL